MLTPRSPSQGLGPHYARHDSNTEQKAAARAYVLIGEKKEGLVGWEGKAR